MKTLFVLFITGVLISACTRCGDEIICTDDLRMILLNVQGTGEQTGILDSAYTIRQSTGEKIRYPQPLGPGHYVVLDDTYQPELRNQEDMFRFIGWKNNAIVVNEEFIIGADNCHIFKRSGADSIRIQ